MLVLTRKEEQQIILSNGVIIKIKKIKGSSVKIGIKAPKSVKILREEIAGDIVKK